MNAQKMPLEFDLVAHDPTQFRTLAEKEWVTARGRRNRIAIGDPLCVRERTPGKNSLLLTEDVKGHGEAHVEFWRVGFSLTLLPDLQCRFRSVDTVLELTGGEGRLPVFVRLKPEEQSTKRAIKVKLGDKAKVSMKEQTLKIFTAEIAADKEVETQFERVDVTMASFGAGTRSAGWRLRLSESRDVPLDTGELNVLVAIPSGRKCQLRFRVAAEIEIQTAVDRVLTHLFVRDSRPNASADYQFP